MNADKLADALRAFPEDPNPFTYRRAYAKAKAVLAAHDAQPAQAAQTVGMPDGYKHIGWVMVPRDDCEKVLCAGFDRDAVSREEEQRIDAARDRLEAALTAPQPSADAED